MSSKPRTTPAELLQSYAISREQAEALRSADPGPIEEAFFSNEGRVAHKWVHYLPVYDRYLGPYRDANPAMLEIGVSFGGSLDMWRRFFGPNAILFGIDVNPACAERVVAPNQVRIGSQDNPHFLNEVVNEMGRLDIVLDDGSHVGRHQEISFRTLFPKLAAGGIYMIEDLHTSYWPGFWQGGMRKPGTGIELLKTLVDDQHAWYHWEPEILALRSQIGAIHIHDSIAVIEKVQGHRPGHVRIG